MVARLRRAARGRVNAVCLGIGFYTLVRERHEAAGIVGARLIRVYLTNKNRAQPKKLTISKIVAELTSWRYVAPKWSACQVSNRIVCCPLGTPILYRGITKIVFA